MLGTSSPNFVETEATPNHRLIKQREDHPTLKPWHRLFRCCPWEVTAMWPVELLCSEAVETLSKLGKEPRRSLALCISEVETEPKLMLGPQRDSWGSCCSPLTPDSPQPCVAGCASSHEAFYASVALCLADACAASVHQARSSQQPLLPDLPQSVMP